MAVEVGAPKQHKQPSRKGKKAWRKNVDLTEVQDGLHALREEIIQTGSGPISEQKSENLFALDTIGSEEIKKKLRVVKPLKADEILAQRSAVPAVDSRKRNSSRVTDGVLESTSKRQKKDWVSKKEIQRLKQVASTTSHLTGVRDGEDEGHVESAIDLWAVEAPTITVAKDLNELEYVPVTRAKVRPTSIAQAPTAMTVSGKPVRAIRHPEAGTSYNPDFEQWESLLSREGAKAVRAEEARLQKEREEGEKQARVDAIAAAISRQADEITYRTDDESAWEGFRTEDEGDTDANTLKQKRPQRKTPAQRNKIKRRKESERQARHEQRTSDRQKRVATAAAAAVVTDLSLIQQNPNQNPEEASSEEKEEEEETEQIHLRRRKLGPIPIPSPRLELVLPDELRESLRELKPEGNLLSDRFRTLLVNGKIEARKPITRDSRKKRKVKVTEKWGYKDFAISAV